MTDTVPSTEDIVNQKQNSCRAFNIALRTAVMAAKQGSMDKAEIALTQAEKLGKDLPAQLEAQSVKARQLIEDIKSGKIPSGQIDKQMKGPVNRSTSMAPEEMLAGSGLSDATPASVKAAADASNFNYMTKLIGIGAAFYVAKKIGFFDQIKKMLKIK